MILNGKTYTWGLPHADLQFLLRQRMYLLYLVENDGPVGWESAYNYVIRRLKCYDEELNGTHN